MDILPILLSLVLILGVRGESDVDEDVDYVNTCLPQLADRCFKGLMPSLMCHMENKGSCTLLGLGDFCSLAAEALQCAADIIDTDCEEGVKNFDSWLKGLQAVRQNICRDNARLLNVVTERPCLNLEEFVECVEDMARVTHVVDLLQVTLSANECNRLLIALPTCNVRATAPHSSCYLPQDAINDIIYTFFSQTECGPTCPQRSHGTCLSSGYILLFILTTIVISILQVILKL